jgi:hypothetical protein
MSILIARFAAVSPKMPVIVGRMPTALDCRDQQQRYVISQMIVRILSQAIHQLCAEIAWGLVPFCYEEILESF